ncbi:MAG: DUF2142 domain-containing protein [Acetobacter cibinongensis]
MFFAFPNTVIYAPITYIPAALTVTIGRHTHMSILQTSYVIRLVNGFISISLCAIGIALARRGALILAFIASLPMTIAVSASCSQDGILIGLVILATGILSRFDKLTDLRTRNWVLLSLLFAVLSVSKPTLLFLSLIPAAFIFNKKKLLAALPFLLSVVSVVLWSQIGIKPVKVQFLAEQGASDSGQVHWILTHLTAIPALAYNTLKDSGRGYVLQGIGVLGWLDTPLPPWFYLSILVIFPAIILVSVSPFLRKETLPQTKIVSAITIISTLLCIGSVFLSLYIIWTVVGWPRVEGVQGRYFLPIIPLLALLFPQLQQGGHVVPAFFYNQAIVAAFCLYLAVDAGVMIPTLSNRYW